MDLLLKYIPFTVITTAAISTLYISFFNINDSGDRMYRIFWIFIVVSLFYYMMKKKNFSTNKIMKRMAFIIVLIVSILIGYTLTNKIISTRFDTRPGAIFLLGMFIIITLIIYSREYLGKELQNLIM